ncbi:MAG TPA: hypothetical protein VLH56_19265 [Dissulfurispiraceae bacterium]|nr:hypothetical protein [Dissulfurispiraceae bacterium]
MSWLSETFGPSLANKVKHALNKFYRRARALRDDALRYYLISQKLPPEQLKQFWRDNRADIRQLLAELREESARLESILPEDNER